MNELMQSAYLTTHIKKKTKKEVKMDGSLRGNREEKAE